MAEEISAIAWAVRTLRLSLKETQEQFARRIRTTLRTVARYEAGSPPHNKVLAQLERLALEHDVADAAITFRDALLSELGITYFSGEQEIIFSTGEERTLTAALLLLKRYGDPSYPHHNATCPQNYRTAWKIIREAIQEPLRDLQYGYEQINRGTWAVRTLAEGNSLEDIASQSGISEKKLREVNALFQHAWPELGGRTDEEKYQRLELVLKVFAQGLPDVDVAQRFLGSNYGLASKLAELYRALIQRKKK